MSVSPADFLDSAVQLATENCEMAKRNSLSRAYYAAFHRAKQEFPFTPPKGMSTHSPYFKHLLEFPENSPQRVTGMKLKTMHARRVVADYRIEYALQKSIAAIQLDAANQIFSLLDGSEGKHAALEG